MKINIIAFSLSVFLNFLLLPFSAMADWEYVGEQLLSNGIMCGGGSIFLGWAHKVADFDSRPRLGDKHEDGIIQYEPVKRPPRFFAIGNWSRPYFDGRTKTIRMLLGANDLTGRTTLRVGAQGYSGIDPIGANVQARASSNTANPNDGKVAEYAISADSIDSLDNFEIVVFATDGGSCDARFKKYYFNKVTVFTDEFNYSATSFPGRWDTGSNGILTIEKGGKGRYTYKNGRIKGSWRGKLFTGDWWQDNASGSFEFELSDDGKSFKGKWRTIDGTHWHHDWNGRRLE